MSAKSPLAEALAATDFRVRCRLSVPPRGLGDGPSTTWCWASFPTLKSPRTGRPDASKAFHGALDGSIRRPPRAPIGLRCACLRPARASSSLDKLPPYHTMRGCSLDPRAEPMSRHHVTVALRTTGVPRWTWSGGWSDFGNVECRA